MNFIIGKKTASKNPIALIDDDQYGDYAGKYVHLREGDGDKSIEFEKGTKLVPMPSITGDSQRLYIAGPTGSGKSTYCSMYIKNFRKQYPNKRFFIFSDVEEDDVLDKLKPIRVRLDEQMEEPIEPELLRDSIILFDDIDSCPNPRIKKAVAILRDGLLTRGRHENITLLCTSHLMTNYKESRVTLNEASGITFFPKSGNAYAIDNVLRKYCGLSKAQADEIMNLDSRWVTVFKNYPMYCMYENGVYLL